MIQEMFRKIKSICRCEPRIRGAAIQINSHEKTIEQQ